MIVLLAAQLLEPEALPPVLEPALNQYGECLFARTSFALERQGKKERQRLIDAAFEQCGEVRKLSEAKAETDLASDPRFGDLKYRRAYVKNRFDSLDAIVRETARGDFDPDKWK